MAGEPAPGAREPSHAGSGCFYFFNQLITLFIFNPHRGCFSVGFQREKERQTHPLAASCGHLPRDPPEVTAPLPAPALAQAQAQRGLWPCSPWHRPRPLGGCPDLSSNPPSRPRLRAGGAGFTPAQGRAGRGQSGCGGRGPRQGGLVSRGSAQIRAEVQTQVSQGRAPSEPRGRVLPTWSSSRGALPLPPSLGESTQLSYRDPGHRGSGPSQ